MEDTDTHTQTHTLMEIKGEFWVRGESEGRKEALALSQKVYRGNKWSPFITKACTSSKYVKQDSFHCKC